MRKKLRTPNAKGEVSALAFFNEVAISQIFPQCGCKGIKANGIETYLRIKNTLHYFAVFLNILTVITKGRGIRPGEALATLYL